MNHRLVERICFAILIVALIVSSALVISLPTHRERTWEHPVYG